SKLSKQPHSSTPYIHPPDPTHPSLLGQVRGKFIGSLYTFSPNFPFKYFEYTLYTFISIYISTLYLIYISSLIKSNTFLGCPVALIFLNSFTIFPSFSIIKVDLSTPIYSLPYIFLSFITSYKL